MPAQRVLCIAIPAGPARVSVFLSPRLTPDEPEVLAPFDFLDWPAVFASASIGFDLAFGDTTIPAEIVSRPESALWRALFDAGTLVRPYLLDSTSPVFGSYPVARVHDMLKSGYQELGADGRLDPTRPDLPAAFAEVRRLFAEAREEPIADDPNRSERERRTTLANGLFNPVTADQVADRLVELARIEAARIRAADGTAEFCPIVPDAEDVPSALAQFVVYHRQPTGPRMDRQEQNPADTRLDFHQRLTALGQFPALLRLLGLVVELELDPAAVPVSTAAAPGLMRVVPRFTSSTGVETSFLTPDTAYIHDHAGVFAAAQAPPDSPSAETVAGLLNLRLTGPAGGQGQFQLVQVDVDGAGLRMLDLVGRAKSGALPPLRSSGLSVVRRGTAPLLHELLTKGRQRMAAVEAGDRVTLYGEDLIRGVRIDIGDPGSGMWRSLHAREGTYRFRTSPEVRELVDEGCAEPTLVQPNPGPAGAGAPDPELPNYVSESLFLWQGWSLAAPRPGEPLPSPEPDPDRDGEPGLEVSFRPPRGSLPRLRFGQRYLFRARIVDLAGNALDPAQADRVIAEMGDQAPVLPRPDGPAGFPFLRFEVVPAPVVLPRVPPQAGDPADRIVIRSNHDLTPDEFATRHAGPHPEYALSGERHVGPPPTWQLLAELCGRFDAAIGTGTDHDRAYDIAARDDVAPGDPRPEPNTTVDWLPDPLAAGASFRNLPGAPPGTVGQVDDGQLAFTEIPLPADRAGEVGSVVTVGFGPPSAWPDLVPFRLRLVEGSGPPSWDAAERLLTVALPKGQRVTIRLASHLDGADTLELFGIWRWTVEGLAGQPDRIEELRRLALLGLSHMLTPGQELTLVHATQQPLEPPVILDLDVVRAAGSTVVHPRGRAGVHFATTGTIELDAHWTELLDDAGERPPWPVERHAKVFASPIAVPAPGDASNGQTATVPVRLDPATGGVEFVAPAIEATVEFLTAAAAAVGAANADLNAAARLAGLPGGTTIHDEPAMMLMTLAEGPASASHWDELARQARQLADVINTQLAFFDAPDSPVHEPEELRRPLTDLALAAAALAGSAESASAEIRRFPVGHELGDTRHRHIRYEITALTRYGEYFDTTLPLTRTSTGVTVNVPSSAVPAAPSVRYIVPTFGWTRTRTEPSTLTSERRGGGLRVYLDRPWYSSGDGELLGVVVAAKREAEEFLRRGGESSVTEVGRDPHWVSARTVTLPTPADFRNIHTTYQRASWDLTAVLGFEVAFDEEGRCFCDLELAPGAAYYPFVRLALVRLQPDSLPGTATSRMVRAEFAQLVPDRGVSVVGGADDRFTVAVTGPTHAGGSSVRVTVQQRVPGTDDDVGWLSADDQVTVAREPSGTGGPTLWAGTVTLPATREPGRFRLLVEEIETHDGPAPVERVVFVETVVL